MSCHAGEASGDTGPPVLTIRGAALRWGSPSGLGQVRGEVLTGDGWSPALLYFLSPRWGPAVKVLGAKD